LIIIANFTGCGVKGNPVVLYKGPDNVMIIRNIKATSSNSNEFNNYFENAATEINFK